LVQRCDILLCHALASHPCIDQVVAKIVGESIGQHGRQALESRILGSFQDAFDMTVAKTQDRSHVVMTGSLATTGKFSIGIKPRPDPPADGE
jgi:hypothetical protein